MPVFTSSIELSDDYPSIQPSLNLNFAGSRALDPRITFTRSTVGTYVDKNGLIKTAGKNEPRFDHDPVTLESLGLLIEKSRTNIIYGGPGQSNIVATSGQANSLTGNNDAYKLAKNSPSSNSQSHGQWSVDGTVSTTSYVMSIFVEKINHSKFFMQTIANNADNLYVYFDIDTGVTSHTDYTAPGNLTVTPSIETYRDGWYRLICRVEGFASSSLASGLRFGFGDPTTGAQQYANGDDEVLVYGAQIEDGNFATSYIPTAESSSAITASTDDFKISGTSFESFINKTEGTLMMEYKNISSFVSTGLPSISDGTGNRYMMFNLATEGSFSAAAVSPGGSVEANLSVNITGASTEFVKAIFAVKENDFALTANGQTPVTDTSGTVFTTPTQFTLEYATGGNDPNAHFKSIKYYPKRLSNAQLQLLTS